MDKVRVNITVDKKNLVRAKKKLHLFGGKLSTLFNAYLEEFVDGIDAKVGEDGKVLREHVEELEKRLQKLEGKR
ncbi:hypothetical protein CMI48_00405 [Candidatus Pacearchaeota archaeon]|nr:hypothetical protein [Candidatus Pacearchaeota archaeon]